MITIYKYRLKITDIQTIHLPKHASILTLQAQSNTLAIWAKVDTEEPLMSHEIRIYGTGHNLDDEIGKYIGSAQIGEFVWHVYW